MDLLIGNIKWLRKKLGLSQMVLADKLNIKRSLLGAYEEGRAAVRPEILQAMADIFGVSTNDLQNKNLANLAPLGTTAVLSAPKPTPSSASYYPPKIEKTEVEQPARILETKPVQRPIAQQPKPAASQWPDEDFIAGKRLKSITITVDSADQELVEVVPASSFSKYADLVKNNDWFTALPKTFYPMVKGPREVFRVFDFSTDDERQMLKPKWVFSRFIRNWHLIKANQILVFTTEKAISLLRTPNEINWEETSWLMKTADGEAHNLLMNEVLEIWEPTLQLGAFDNEETNQINQTTPSATNADTIRTEIPEAFLEVIKDLKIEVEKLREVVDRKQGGQQQLSLGLSGNG